VHKAKKAIATDDRPDADEPGSYHRNSVEGEWNWKIDPEAGPREAAITTSIGRRGWVRAEKAGMRIAISGSEVLDYSGASPPTCSFTWCAAEHLLAGAAVPASRFGRRRYLRF